MSLMTHKEVRAYAERIGIKCGTTKDFVPKLKADYVFVKEHVIDLMLFWASGMTAMKLIGYIGTGKTTLVEQFHAALGLPLLKVVMTEDTRESDLICGPMMDQTGKIVPTLGPLARAAMQGITVLFDEFNVVEPSVAVSLNGVLEGSSQIMPMLNTQLHVAESFRCFVCINPNDRSLGYSGRNNQDPSNDDRFGMNLWIDYPTPEDEIPVVCKALAPLFASPAEQDSGKWEPETIAQAKSLATCFVSVANSIRAQYIGQSDAGEFEVTMSRRSLMNWVNLSVLSKMSGLPNPIVSAIDKTFLNRLSPNSPTKVAVHDFVAGAFGEAMSSAIK